MLAHDYSKRGKDIIYPAYVQPKLDGIRVIAHRTANGVRFFSRNEKEFHTLGHLCAQIMAISPPGAWLDGEIYVHGGSFESICSAVKRDKPNIDSKKMQYWCFDIAQLDVSHSWAFQHRNKMLKEFAENNKGKELIFLPAVLVENELQMMKVHKIFIANGFEGTIIRNAHANYVNKRSINLQKYKDFDNEEFEIIGMKQATGKDVGMIIFICITKKGVEFDVEPAGSDDLRREMWNRAYGNEGLFEGKKLSVKFQGYLQSGAPRFPTAGVVRDYE